MNQFDLKVKESLNAMEIETHLDQLDMIFEKAWTNKNHQVKKVEFPLFERKKLILATTCLLIFCLNLPPVRSFAEDVASQLYEIFFVDTNGELLEGDKTLIIPYYNLGGETVTDKNKSYFTELLGCEFYLPPTINGLNNTYHHSSKTSFGITLYGMEYKRFEESHLEIYDQILNKNLDETYSDVKYTTSLTTTYYLEGTQTEIHVRAGSASEDVLNLNQKIYNDLRPVDLSSGHTGWYYTKVLGNYKKRLNQGWTESDLTKAPKGTEIVEYLYFIHEGTAYSVTATMEPSENSKLIMKTFAESFIYNIQNL